MTDSGCPRCDGTGYDNSLKCSCPLCAGKGSVRLQVFGALATVQPFKSDQERFGVLRHVNNSGAMSWGRDRKGASSGVPLLWPHLSGEHFLQRRSDNRRFVATWRPADRRWTVHGRTPFSVEAAHVMDAFRYLGPAYEPVDVNRAIRTALNMLQDYATERGMGREVSAAVQSWLKEAPR